MSRSIRRDWLIPLFGLLILSTVAGWIGDALSPQLYDRRPLLLIALNARNRILVLTSDRTSALSFYIVATLRLLSADPLFYACGRIYGFSATDRLRARSRRRAGRLKKVLAIVSRHPNAYLGLPVFIAPNAVICTVAGAAGMAPWVFIVTNLAGTIVSLIVIRHAAAEWTPYISYVGDLIVRWRTVATVLTVGTVAVAVWNTPWARHIGCRPVPEYRTPDGESNPAPTERTESSEE